MAHLSIESKPYKTYILTDSQAQTRLEIVPERGGIVTRWQVRGQEILYLDAERFANPELSVRGGIPILFPICGNLPDNTYVHQGQTYTLKQHGFARDLPWSVGDAVSPLVADSIASDQVAITLSLESSDRTLASYPFQFRLEFTYLLQGSSLIIHQSFTNLDAVAMPFSTGLHPYFNVANANVANANVANANVANANVANTNVANANVANTNVANKAQLEFDIPAMQYRNQRDQTTHAFSGNFDFTQDEIDFAFPNPTRPTASVTDVDRKLKLTLISDSRYSTLVFWTLKDKPFYCLEPWTAGRNALNTGENLTHLNPGDRLELRVVLQVEEL